jgi:hypothetical protein
VDVPETRSEIRKEIIRLFRSIGELKSRRESRLRSIEQMQHFQGIRVYDLMEMMFSVIVNAMYKEEWGNLSDHRAMKSEIEAFLKETKTDDYEVKVSYEETVSYEGMVSPEETISFEKTLSYNSKSMMEKTI